MDEHSAHIEVELNIAPDPTGYRKLYLPTSFQDGPAFTFRGQSNTCVVYAAGKECLEPGEQGVRAFINFVCPELVAPRLRLGEEFVLGYAHWIAATGKVTKLLTLEQAAL